MKKLTAKQIEVLRALTAGPASADTLGCSVVTFNALCDKRLANPIGFGHMTFPRNARWELTKAGRALAEAV
jgi:hypothetical protein